MMSEDEIRCAGSPRIGSCLAWHERRDHRADVAEVGAQLGITTPLLDLATMQLRVYNN
jgi:hypothetical protein